MIVLVHGVPETAELWDDVRERLDQPSVALKMPGFGCARPEGFSATKDAYVDWLLGEIDAIDAPIDLVGHDWGGGLSLRIGTKHPETVRSWVTDVASLFHPDYVWHDFAQIWQSTEGEAFFENQLAAGAEANVPTYQMFGLDDPNALKLAEMGDETMASCILDLYRSAVPNPYADWGADFKPNDTPALVIVNTGDMFADADRSREIATQLGAKTAEIEAGHFWPMQIPDAGAKVINDFVNALS